MMFLMWRLAEHEDYKLNDLQHQVLIEAVENHMPEVIIIDEISTETETFSNALLLNVQLIATAHGNRLVNLVKNPILVNLIGVFSQSLLVTNL